MAATRAGTAVSDPRTVPVDAPVEGVVPPGLAELSCRSSMTVAAPAPAPMMASASRTRIQRSPGRRLSLGRLAACGRTGALAAAGIFTGAAGRACEYHEEKSGS